MSGKPIPIAGSNGAGAGAGGGGKCGVVGCGKPISAETFCAEHYPMFKGSAQAQNAATATMACALPPLPLFSPCRYEQFISLLSCDFVGLGLTAAAASLKQLRKQKPRVQKQPLQHSQQKAVAVEAINTAAVVVMETSLSRQPILKCCRIDYAVCGVLPNASSVKIYRDWPNE